MPRLSYIRVLPLYLITRVATFVTRVLAHVAELLYPCSPDSGSQIQFSAGGEGVRA